MELKDFEKKSNTIIETFKTELSEIRGNRPAPKLVEDLKVEYFGQLLAIKQLANLSVVPPLEIDINVWDKNAVSAIAKVIEASNLGFSVSIQGSMIRLNLPLLSEERRQELVKLVKKTAEDFRIRLRHIRDEVNKQIQKEEDESAISEDDKFALKEEVQKITDKINGEIENILKNKIAEII
ncbi:MAG: ribosome recycling factor [Candidatus Brennerbacteria bacterium]|nr:ribosome recycling factor [Candidatus Brennerbacteria bacterium]